MGLKKVKREAGSLMDGFYQEIKVVLVGKKRRKFGNPYKRRKAR